MNLLQTKKNEKKNWFDFLEYFLSQNIFFRLERLLFKKNMSLKKIRLDMSLLDGEKAIKMQLAYEIRVEAL